MPVFSNIFLQIPCALENRHHVKAGLRRARGSLLPLPAFFLILVPWYHRHSWTWWGFSVVPCFLDSCLLAGAADRPDIFCNLQHQDKESRLKPSKSLPLGPGKMCLSLFGHTGVTVITEGTEADSRLVFSSFI